MADEKPNNRINTIRAEEGAKEVLSVIVNLSRHSKIEDERTFKFLCSDEYKCDCNTQCKCENYCKCDSQCRKYCSCVGHCECDSDCSCDDHICSCDNDTCRSDSGGDCNYGGGGTGGGR